MPTVSYGFANTRGEANTVGAQTICSPGPQGRRLIARLSVSSNILSCRLGAFAASIGAAPRSPAIRTHVAEAHPPRVVLRRRLQTSLGHRRRADARAVLPRSTRHGPRARHLSIGASCVTRAGEPAREPESPRPTAAAR